MRITVNGHQKKILDKSNLQNIIEQFCRDSRHVIAQVNGQIVKSHEWTQRTIESGDTVELINFVGGG